MSRNKKFFCLILIIFVIVSICGYSFIKNRYNIGRNVVYSNTDTLINISELSEKFMNDYFKEISEIKEDDKDNILIVTSKEKLKKTYGAKKVIEAPNNQYFIQYNSKEEMDKAHEQFTINNPSIKIDNNIKYEISDDSVVAYSYNS